MALDETERPRHVAHHVGYWGGGLCGDRRVDGGAGGGREVAVTVCSTYGGSPSILTSSS